MGRDYEPIVVYGYLCKERLLENVVLEEEEPSIVIKKLQEYYKVMPKPFHIIPLITGDENGYNYDIVIGFKPLDDLEKTIELHNQLKEYIKNNMSDIEIYPEAKFHRGVLEYTETFDGDDCDMLNSIKGDYIGDYK